MAFHSKAEFANLCGMAGSNELSVYISRGKVVLNGEFVDDKDIRNKDFLQKRQAKKSKKPKGVPDHVIESAKKDNGPKVKETKVVTIPASKPLEPYDDGGVYGLEKQQKALSIEKIRKENELLDVRIAKAHGEAVPTDLVKPLFSIHSKSMSAAFYNAADSLLARFAKKYKVSAADIATYRGELVDIVNRATLDAIESSKEGLNAIIQEYSDKRGVGEKK